jgi:hypothetical protein
MESMSKAFVYIAGILESVSRAGKALAGWERTKIKIFQPSCIFMNLMIKLFQCSVPQMKRTGRLWPLANCLLATTLMYLSETMVKYPRHKILVVVREMAEDCDITMKELLEWGRLVKDKFTTDHAVAVHQGNELMPIVFEKIVEMERNEKSNSEVSKVMSN